MSPTSYDLILYTGLKVDSYRSHITLKSLAVNSDSYRAKVHYRIISGLMMQTS